MLFTRVRSVLAGVLLSVGLLTACQPPIPEPVPQPVHHPLGVVSPELGMLVLTDDVAGTYDVITPAANAVTISASTNPDPNYWSTAWNHRLVTWRHSDGAAKDGKVCADFASAEAFAQEGLALRVTSTRAITVTKNIYGGFNSTFNINLWSLQAPQILETPFQFNFQKVFGGNPPQPWHMCANVVGRLLILQVMPLRHGSDNLLIERGFVLVGLPEGWDYPGHFGVYGGHVRARQSIRYGNLVVDLDLPLVPSPSTL